MHIVYEDEHILVVNKPSGIPVLPDGWEPDAPYLARLLEEKYAPFAPEPTEKNIWVVHRLDKVTSGVMVFARTAEAHRQLNRQFELREIEKTYHAILTGSPAWNERSAKHPLRVNVGHKHRTMVDHSKGKPSETFLRVLARYPDAALALARPLSGRTHQVRVHAYALGHPLMGDTLYSAPPTELIARPALHALSLTFMHPYSGVKVTFQAPYPQDFENALAQLNASHSTL